MFKLSKEVLVLWDMVSDHINVSQRWKGYKRLYSNSRENINDVKTWLN